MHSFGFAAVTTSAEARFLLGDSPAARTLIFDAVTGWLVFSPPASQHAGFAWSPTGHALVVTNDDSVYWLAEPGDPAAKMEKLVDGQCGSMMWNPAGGK